MQPTDMPGVERKMKLCLRCGHTEFRQFLLRRVFTANGLTGNRVVRTQLRTACTGFTLCPGHTGVRSYLVT